MQCTPMLLFLVLTVEIVMMGKESSARSLQLPLDQRERQEIMVMAARIIKIAMSGMSSPDDVQAKRNAGTIDSLYNLPDLITAAGK